MIDADDGLGGALAYLASGLQVALVGVFLFAALVERSFGLGVNSGVPLAIALLPRYVRHRHDYRLNPVLTLVIVGGAAFHSVGSLGFYRSIGWFDQLAHGVAGALIAGVGYALVQVVDTQHDRITIPPRLRFVFVVVFAVAVGAAWEIVEFSLELVSVALGGDALLAQYGLADVVLDLQFDLLGALVLAAWGTSYFDGLRRLVDDYLGVSDGDDFRSG